MRESRSRQTPGKGMDPLPNTSDVVTGADVSSRAGKGEHTGANLARSCPHNGRARRPAVRSDAVYGELG